MILAITLAASALCVGTVLLLGGPDKSVDGKDILAAEDFGPSYTVTNTSFFEDQFTDIDPGKGEYINQKYDEFPLANNPTNLQSHGTATYANINGTTVTADAYYRVVGEALNDPNAGLGLLLYQCIQYKIAHPEEDVSICFPSYRVSPTIAVCVLPESRYYGYMRSLYGSGNDYDSNGFVRIVYMLVEAAKMGIDVTVVGQLNSYGVKQYDSSGALKTKSENSYISYFNEGLKQACYDKYAKGKKVSDFLTFAPVDWTVTEKGAIDMMHLKALTASHYLATDGTEHENAVFLSSSNLDAINYAGCNGQGNAQSGTVITGHREIYCAATNYIKLMSEYPGQEDVYELRHVILEKNLEQNELIKSGRDGEIADDERILYLGSETDKVFKFYLTPLPSDMDAWDTDSNPVCEHVDKLYRSSINYPDEPLTFAYNCASYIPSSNVAKTMLNMIDRAFLETANPENRLYIHAKDYPTSSLAALTAGETVGFKYLKNSSITVHSKDMQFSYVSEDERQYVSLLTSCNFHVGALYYQTNSLLVINETEETGNEFYKIFGDAATNGCIVND